MGNIIRGGNGEVIDIVIRDFSGARIQSFKSNSEDEKTNTRIIRILIEKYGIKINLQKLLNREIHEELLDPDSEFFKF